MQTTYGDIPDIAVRLGPAWQSRQAIIFRLAALFFRIVQFPTVNPLSFAPTQPGLSAGDIAGGSISL
jgi:hypothetical protein